MNFKHFEKFYNWLKKTPTREIKDKLKCDYTFTKNERNIAIKYLEERGK